MAMPQMDESKMKLVQELEIEMMTDMYAKLTAACHKKVKTESDFGYLCGFAVHRTEVSGARSSERGGSLH